jgi:hypothetical protein
MVEIVECHSGFAYEDRPVAFIWDGQRQEILRVLTEWRSPEYKLFIVGTTGNLVFRLAYHLATERWEIEQQ